MTSTSVNSVNERAECLKDFYDVMKTETWIMSSTILIHQDEMKYENCVRHYKKFSHDSRCTGGCVG